MCYGTKHTHTHTHTSHINKKKIKTIKKNKKQMSPHCDPELEDSKPVFLHDTLTHDVASSYQVWLQKVQQLRRYRPGEHSPEFWTFSVTLSWTTTEQSNLFTRFSVSWCFQPSHFHKTIHPKVMCCKSISSSDNILESHILIILSLTVTLTLKTANQSDWQTIWLILVHQHTKFGGKMFSE